MGGGDFYREPLPPPNHIPDLVLNFLKRLHFLEQKFLKIFFFRNFFLMENYGQKSFVWGILR